MALDILSIAPHEVSRDLGGYTILFYGAPDRMCNHDCLYSISPFLHSIAKTGLFKPNICINSLGQ